MSAAGLSLFAFGIYMVLSGLGFSFVPNTMLGLLGVAETTEHWIRILGLVLVALGYYYVQVARRDVRVFYAWSVHARVGVAVMFVGFVAVSWAPPTILLFGATEVVGATWTLLALRAQGQQAND